MYCKEDTISQHKAIYRRLLKKTVEEAIVKFYYDAQNDFNDIKIPKIEVKGLRTAKAFGMNSWETIYLSYDLGRYDPIYIKTVLYHELCHFYEIEHNDAFYKKMDEKLENGAKLDKDLDTLNYFDEF